MLLLLDPPSPAQSNILLQELSAANLTANVKLTAVPKLMYPRSRN